MEIKSSKKLTNYSAKKVIQTKIDRNPYTILSAESFDVAVINANPFVVVHIQQINNPSETFTGVAKCNPVDKFSLAVGIQIATKKAMDDFMWKVDGIPKRGGK